MVVNETKQKEQVVSEITIIYNNGRKQTEIINIQVVNEENKIYSNGCKRNKTIITSCERDKTIQ